MRWLKEVLLLPLFPPTACLKRSTLPFLRLFVLGDCSGHLTKNRALNREDGTESQSFRGLDFETPVVTVYVNLMNDQSPSTNAHKFMSSTTSILLREFLATAASGYDSALHY